MYLPHQLREKNSIKQFAKASLEAPGMYLIALRSHLGRGKTMIGDVIKSVAEALPEPRKFQKPDEA